MLRSYDAGLDAPMMLFKDLIYRGFEVGGKSNLLIPLNHEVSNIKGKR